MQFSLLPQFLLLLLLLLLFLLLFLSFSQVLALYKIHDRHPDMNDVNQQPPFIFYAPTVLFTLIPDIQDKIKKLLQKSGNTKKENNVGVIKRRQKAWWRDGLPFIVLYHIRLSSFNTILLIIMLTHIISFVVLAIFLIDYLAKSVAATALDQVVK